MSRLPQIPDVSFMGNTTIASLKQTALDEYTSAITELTGKCDGIPDEDKAILFTAAQIFYQLAETIDKKARQNLLKYAEGDYLDNLAARKPLERKEAEFAVVTIRFKLSAAQKNPVAIPAGTRVTSAAAIIYFATSEYAEIQAGEEYTDVQCVSITGGTAANGFDVGELNVLVDPIPYIASATNIDVPTGGADRETDDAFAERIYQARTLYSTTGSKDAYIYYVKSYSTLIDDAVPTNPSDAEIVIYITMKDRELATESFLQGLQDFLNAPAIRPLTDKITVKNIARVNYSVDIEYTVYDADVTRLTEIDSAVKAAVEEYKTWQSAKIGRDMNTQDLIMRVKAAGAAKVAVKSPTDTTILQEQIAFCDNTTITYKGFIEE